MIEINVALQHDQIIELLNNYNQDGVTFSFKEKKGIHLYFETNSEDLEKACKIAKEAIKKQPWGSVLFFQVNPVT